MKLKRVEIVNFYSYRSYVIEVRDGLFNVWGLNGQGKTSLQLAIRLGLGWSPATRVEESLENAIHEDEEQCRITLVFDNSDNCLRGYPEEVRIERRIIRGDARPRMRMTTSNGELLTKSQLDIRKEFSKVGYDPDDSGIFIEQGDLRSFYTVSFSSLLDKCIGLAGLKTTNENVKQTERAFCQIEEVKKEGQQAISEMEDELEHYRLGFDTHMKFCDYDEYIKHIELENKAIRYHRKRIENLKVYEEMQEKKETLEEYKDELESSRKNVEDARKRLEGFKKEREALEEQRGNLKEILDRIYKDRNQKLERQKELEALIPKLKDRKLPTIKKAKLNVERIKKELSSIHLKLGKQQEELKTIRSQLADIESGLALGVVPLKQKTLKQKLVDAGIKTEFLADCLEIKKGNESFQEQLETLLDPFKFHLVLRKKDISKAIEILRNETEVGIIIPDDWPPSEYTQKTAQDYLVIKESAPKELQDFLSYFVFRHENCYGPKEMAFLVPSIRFHRIHLSAHPQNNNPAIGEEGRRIAYELILKQKKSLEKQIKEVNLEIKQTEQEFGNAKEVLDLAGKKPDIPKYEKEVKAIQIEINKLDKETQNALSNNSNLDRKVGELDIKIDDEDQLIRKQNLPIVEKRVTNWEKHFQVIKRKFENKEKETELIKKDCDSDYIEKIDGLTEGGLIKASQANDKQRKEINIALEELEKTFTRERAEFDFHAFENQKSLIKEKKDALKKQQEQVNLLKVEWDKAQQTYKRMATQLFNRANLTFRELYKSQNNGTDGQITPNFKVMPPELDIRIKVGKRKRMVPLNAKVGGPSGGERLAAIVNLIVSILKARDELAKSDPDLYRPQSFICIDEPQQDMDDPVFRNAILNFKGVMKNTQILILTHKPLPDPELWQLWLFLHPELGTLGKSHRGEIHKLVGD